MRSEQQEKLMHFLRDVDEQIAYRPICAAVNEELRAHVEDKAEVYMEYGVEEDEAYDKAIRDMGDASAIGIQMNEAHHLRTAKPLLFSLLALLALGLAGSFVIQGVSVWEVKQNLYFLWGLAVLMLTAWYGYPLLLKHAGGLLLLLSGGTGLFVILCLAVRCFPGWKIPAVLRRLLFSPSLSFGMMQIAVLAGVVLLYRKRRQGLKSLLWISVVQLVLVFFLTYSYWWGLADSSFVTVLCTCLGIELYMIEKEYLKADKKKSFAAAIGSFLGILMIWGGFQGERLSGELTLFINPKAQADTAWEDGYNNVLIQELLGRAEAFGEIRLSQEERIRYGTARWYYEDGPGVWKGNSGGAWETLERHVEYRMQFMDDPQLGDILPQHYYNNYRIAWWILRYGWIPGMLLTALPAAAYGLLFLTALRIRNRLGRLVALAGSIAIGIQFLFYLLGNFGYQFGMFGNLPFVSEGFISITGSALMAGLTLSAYRFDTVVAETQ